MSKSKSLADWMTQRNVTLEQLVESSGLDAKIVTAIAKGQYVPSPQQRRRLAAVLEVEPADVAWGHTIAVQHVYGHGPQFGRSP